MLTFVRAIAAATAVVEAAVALRLVLFGRLHFELGPIVIRGDDPSRPIAIAILAALIFAAAGGWRRTTEAWRRARQDWPRASGVLALRAAVVLAVLVFAVTLDGAATTGGGADSSGYVSQADRWLHGTLTPAQPWVGEVPWPNAADTFTPLGYTALEQHPPFRLAPTYPPGLPLLLAAAKAVGGQPAMSLVVPAACAVFVLATFGIGWRLRSPFAGLTAAWLVATSPIMLLMGMSPMSDVPAAAGWTVSFYCLLGAGTYAPLASGVAAAAAIAIRPNLAFLAPILAVGWLLRCGARKAGGWPAQARDAALFVTGSAPGVVFIAMFFDRLYGSPFQSGYGGFFDSLSLSHVWANLAGYAQRAMGSEPLLAAAGVIGLAIPSLWSRSNRAVWLAVALVVAVVAEYAAYLVFPEWIFLRFLLVIWPLLAVAAAGTIVAVASRGGRIGAIATTLVLAASAIFGMVQARAHGAFDVWHSERRYASVAAIVHDRVPPNAVVFSLQHSGTLRYYSGRMPLRYDALDGEWLDRSVDWLAAAGVPAFAVLESWEVDRFREHFAGQEHLKALDSPIFTYYGYRRDTVVYLYDLRVLSGDALTPAYRLDSDVTAARNQRPEPDPVLVFRRPR